MGRFPRDHLIPDGKSRAERWAISDENHGACSSWLRTCMARLKPAGECMAQAVRTSASSRCVGVRLARASPLTLAGRTFKSDGEDEALRCGDSPGRTFSPGQRG